MTQIKALGRSKTAQVFEALCRE